MREAIEIGEGLKTEKEFKNMKIKPKAYHPNLEEYDASDISSTEVKKAGLIFKIELIQILTHH